jgi:hypothetical protein
MSAELHSRTFSIPASQVPATFASKEDFTAFAEHSAKQARARPDSVHYLDGSTRSGWALDTAWNAAKAVPGNDVLSFLRSKGRTANFDDEYSNTAVTILSLAEVKEAAQRLGALLDAMRADPMVVYNADETGIFYGDDVEQALARDYVSVNPRFDRQVRGDEGQSADYLLTFMRSTLAVLNSAASEGLAVVHYVTC